VSRAALTQKLAKGKLLVIHIEERKKNKKYMR
jgi:hypothetical protein